MNGGWLLGAHARAGGQGLGDPAWRFAAAGRFQRRAFEASLPR